MKALGSEPPIVVRLIGKLVNTLAPMIIVPWCRATGKSIEDQIRATAKVSYATGFAVGFVLGFILIAMARLARARDTIIRNGLNAIILVIPKSHRDEIVGDCYESLAHARRLNLPKPLRWLVLAAKIALYVWITLGLRITDLVTASHRSAD